MDYNRNFDQLDYTNSSPTIYGLQYSVVEDISSEPVDLAFFKKHAYIDFNVDDDLCLKYIASARIFLEQTAQKSFKAKKLKLSAIYLPKDWRVMYGPVSTVDTAGFTFVGDILKEGGHDIEVVYNTLGFIDDNIRIAICRYAAGLYINRENVMLNSNGTAINSANVMDEAIKMIRPQSNVTFL